MRSFVAAAALLILAIGCGSEGPGEAQSGLSGNIRVDGSSTVFPLTAAVAEDFQRANRRVSIPVGFSGTGGGMSKFMNGETAITGASRPVRQVEVERGVANGIEFIELPVAFDGLTVVVHRDNDFVDYLSVDELERMWRPGSDIQRWNQIRDNWPDQPIELFGAGADSGTFDYFTEAITGELGRVRPDFTASEDDNLIVQGVGGNRFALGFFGFSYYLENRDRIRSVAIKHGDADPVAPTPETINDGTYQPLARPVFIYVSKADAERPEVEAFIEFWLEDNGSIAADVGFVPLGDRAYELALERFRNRVTGSVFEGAGPTIGVKLEDLLTGNFDSAQE